MGQSELEHEVVYCPRSSDTAYVEVGFVPPFGNRRGSVIDAVHDCGSAYLPYICSNYVSAVLRRSVDPAERGRRLGKVE